MVRATLRIVVSGAAPRAGLQFRDLALDYLWRNKAGIAHRRLLHDGSFYGCMFCRRPQALRALLFVFDLRPARIPCDAPLLLEDQGLRHQLTVHKVRHAYFVRLIKEKMKPVASG